MGIEDLLAQAEWRKSSFSGNGGNGSGGCVEAAQLPDGRIAVRNSNDRDAGYVLFTRNEIDAWLKGVKSGEFDYLA